MRRSFRGLIQPSWRSAVFAERPIFSHPEASELGEITKLIDAGKIKPIVTQILPLTDAAKADAQAETHHTRGKIVLKIADEPKP